MARTLGPTAVYAGFILVVMGGLRLAGIDGSVLELGGWAVAMHLWFLAVYLMVVGLTPVAVAAHRAGDSQYPLHWRWALSSSIR